MSFLKSLAIITILAAIPLPAYSEEERKWLPQFEIETKLASDGRNIAVPKYMMPLWQDEDSMLFTDIRTRFDNRDSEEMNFGLGFRRIINDRIILTGYGFFDQLRSTNDFTYDQYTIGAELLTEDWDFRANIYMPETDVNAITGGGGSGTLTFNGGVFTATTGGNSERALQGYDFEIGYRVPIQEVDMKIFAGQFHFEEDAFGKIIGPRARLELTLDDKNIDFFDEGMELTFGAEAQSDSTRGELGLALLELKIPFNFVEHKPRSKLTKLEKRMTDFVERDVDIITSGDSTVTENALIEGRTLDNLVTLDAADNLVTAVPAAGNDALIIIDGDAGQIGTTGEILMQPGQVILGGGGSVNVTGATTGTTFTFEYGGSMPTIDRGSGGDMLRTANNTTIRNIRLQDTSDEAIFVSDSTNVLIEDVTIDDVGDNGTNIRNSSNITYRNFTASNISDRGIIVENDSSDVDIINSAISNTSNSGIDIQGDTVNITNTTITNAGNGAATDAGISVLNADDVTLTDVTITDADNVGIYIDDGNNLTLENVTVVDVGADETNKIIHFVDNFDGFVVNNSTFNGSTDEGIEFNGGFTIDNVSGSNNQILNVSDIDCDVEGGAVVNGSFGLVGGGTCP